MATAASSTHSFIRIRHLSELTTLSQSTVPITPSSSKLLPSWGTGILCFLPSFFVPFTPTFILTEMRDQMKGDEPLTITLSESGNDQIHLISADTHFSVGIISSLLTPRQDPPQGNPGHGLEICHLLTVNISDLRPTSPFLTGVILSTPWQMMLSHTEELGLLSRIKCNSKETEDSHFVP
jgi:hypothetical protein